MSQTHRARSRVETELPPALRDQANRLILEGMTYEDLSAWSSEQGYDISKSSWGRYGKRYYQAYQQIRQFEDQSRALAGEAGEGLTMEEALTKLILQKVTESVLGGEWDLMEAPQLLSEVARLQNSNIAREKLKDELARRMRETGEKALKEIETNPADPERIKTVIRESYGI